MGLERIEVKDRTGKKTIGYLVSYDFPVPENPLKLNRNLCYFYLADRKFNLVYIWGHYGPCK